MQREMSNNVIEEQDDEITLRPKKMDEYVGQASAKEMLNNIKKN